jgi:hypothetical protein
LGDRSKDQLPPHSAASQRKRGNFEKGEKPAKTGVFKLARQDQNLEGEVSVAVRVAELFRKELQVRL